MDSVLLITPTTAVSDRILSFLPSSTETATVTTATISLGSYATNATHTPYITALVPQFIALPTPPTHIFLAGPVEPSVLALVEALHKSENDTLRQMREAERRDAAERSVDEYGNARRAVDAASTADTPPPLPSFHVLKPLEPHATMADEIASYIKSLKAGSPRSDIGPERFARYLAALISPPFPTPPPALAPPAAPPSHFYRCRSCRHPLFLPAALVPHPACSSPPFAPPASMRPSLSILQGVIKCPNCTKAFGTFNHSGLKCGCNKFLTEGMIFTLSKVDPPLPSTVPGVTLQVTLVKAAPEEGVWKGVKQKDDLHELAERNNDGGFRRKRSQPKPKHPAENQLYDNK